MGVRWKRNSAWVTRSRRWPALRPALDLAQRSLQAAALAYLELSIERGLRERWQPHPMAARARNALLDRNGRQETAQQ